MQIVSQWWSEWWKSLDPLIAYVSFCVSEPIQAPVCRQFWTWTMVAAFSFAVVVALVTIWRVVSYRLKLGAALRAQQERERIADEETLARYKWTGDDHPAVEVGDGDDIETRIRNFLNERRSGNIG